MASISTEIKTNHKGEVQVRVRREGRWGYTICNLDEFRDLMNKGPETLQRMEELDAAQRKARGE